ncbi:HV323 protein, partial [Crotophaga sulcirostris]|nr:HV323 protein [Crotophaga sulcirostris]
QPGGHLSLLCTTSGFTFSSFSMSWVRQRPGQGLEFVASIDIFGSTWYAPAVKGRFTLSRDDGQGTVTLQMNSLKSQGTATHWG